MHTNKYIGIKGLGTLAAQIGAGYIKVVMYNDNSDLLQFRQRFKETKEEILNLLETYNWNHQLFLLFIKSQVF